MNTFSKLIENNNNKKRYKIIAEIEIIVEADNEGEAGYKSDSILASIKEKTEFSIKSIEEVFNSDISESFKKQNK